MSALKSLWAIFFPASCVCCEDMLLENEMIICTNCRHDLPLIYPNDYYKNPIVNAFIGKIPIQMGAAFLSFQKQGKAQLLIHHLKYKNRQDIGTLIGNWFGFELNKSFCFSTIDYIVPVPLHPKKLKKRGYNQLTTFGKSLAEQLKTEYIPNILTKISENTTQTQEHRYDRFLNVRKSFLLTDNQFFKNKHILLVDDVITTGATIEACCLELYKTPGIKISIASIAFTE